MREILRRLTPTRFSRQQREPVKLRVYCSEDELAEFSTRMENKAEVFLSYKSVGWATKQFGSGPAIFRVVLAVNNGRRFGVIKGHMEIDSQDASSISISELESDGTESAAFSSLGGFKKFGHRMTRIEVVDFADAFLSSEIDEDVTDKILPEELSAGFLRLL